ncbi:hypothetical protein NGF19_29535 [Streptomyces sp. RY43-2]|uniref:Lipoprotein n=1 Tax=Streptomyces macrolidinus TaxID=2952607 RepID=A0ABT0ZMV5_9ACTN|nr:hypothetical protein [Streptomyces macrolidinus]MCN9244875.1 hypothetical protein [Streptomyces macrolidinus]
MRKAVRAAVATVIAGVVLSGCGDSDGDQPEAKAKAKASASADADTGAGTAEQKQSASPAGDGIIGRATGSWKSIVASDSATSLSTLTIEAGGKVSAKGGKLDCTGTMKPGEEDGKDAPTLTLSCAGGDDGGRGVGTVGMKGDDALAIDWAGPEGGWGGPVDSFRRTAG